MRTPVARFLGGPAGRMHFLVLELAASPHNVHDAVMELTRAELNAAAAAELLAPGDHLTRLASGDRLFGFRAPDGQLIGVVWMNVSGVVDTYAGKWVKPDGHTSYLNQLMVSPAARRQGVATSLIRAVQDAAVRAGHTRVLALVQPSNHASVGTFERAGAVQVGRFRGARLGKLTVRVNVDPLRRHHGRGQPSARLPTRS